MAKLTRPDAAGKNYEIIIADVSRITAKQPHYSLMVIHKTDATKGYWPKKTYTEAEAIAEAKKRGIKTIREVLGAKTVRTIKVNPRTKAQRKRNPTYKDMLRIARQRIKAKDYMGAHEAITASGANMIDIQEFFTKAELEKMRKWANQKLGATPKRKKNPRRRKYDPADYGFHRAGDGLWVTRRGSNRYIGKMDDGRFVPISYGSPKGPTRAMRKAVEEAYQIYLSRQPARPAIPLHQYAVNPKRIGQGWDAYYRPAHDYLDDDEMDALPVQGSKSLAKKLLHWHYGQSDPIYAVGSSWLAGRPVRMGLVEDALSNIQKEDTYLMAARDKTEHRDVVMGLKHAMQRAFNNA